MNGEIETMQPDRGLQVDEKLVIRKQYIAFAIGMVLFIPLSLISNDLADTPKYGMLGPVAMMVYIGISSITNRVSALRIRGRREPSRDKQAVIFGGVLLGIAIYAVIAIYVPSLSKIFFPF